MMNLTGWENKGLGDNITEINTGPSDDVTITITEVDMASHRW